MALKDNVAHVIFVVYFFLRKMISKQRGIFKMLFWVVFKSINKRSNRRALFSCQVLQTINTKLERFMCWLMGTCAKTYTSLYMPSYYICCLIASQNVVECTFSIKFQVHGRIEGYNWGKCVNFIREKRFIDTALWCLYPSPVKTPHVIEFYTRGKYRP